MKLGVHRILTQGELADLKSELTDHRRQLEKLHNQMRDAYPNARERAEQEADRLGDSIDPAGRKAFIESRVVGLVNERRQAIRAEAAQLGKAVGAAKNVLDESREAFTNRRRLLDGGTLGSSRRAAFAENLKESGPVAIRNAAERAIADQDEALAAAVASRVESMPTKARPFHVAALMEKLPDELPVFEPARKFAEAESILADVLSFFYDVQAFKHNPTRAIERGIRARQAAGEPIGDPEGGE